MLYLRVSARRRAAKRYRSNASRPLCGIMRAIKPDIYTKSILAIVAACLLTLSLCLQTLVAPHGVSAQTSPMRVTVVGPDGDAAMVLHGNQLVDQSHMPPVQITGMPRVEIVSAFNHPVRVSFDGTQPVKVVQPDPIPCFS